MLASSPASILNHKTAAMGIPERFNQSMNRSSAARDHAERTARITRRSCASDTSAPARTITPPMTISIIDNPAVSTSTKCGPSGASGGVTVPLRIAWRRQPNSCDGTIPSRRAIAETLAPGASVSATSRALNASDHSRRTRRGAPSYRSGTASITWKLLSSGIVADVEIDTDPCRLIQCLYAFIPASATWDRLGAYEQPHRAGSPSRQAPCSVHARLQVAVECRRHSFRHRDGQHDAQTTGEVCLIRRPRSLSSSKFSPPDHLFGCVVLRPKVRFATHPTKQPN